MRICFYLEKRKKYKAQEIKLALLRDGVHLVPKASRRAPNIKDRRCYDARVHVELRLGPLEVRVDRRPVLAITSGWTNPTVW